jgi:hypothetical protein
MRRPVYIVEGRDDLPALILRLKNLANLSLVECRLLQSIAVTVAADDRPTAG